MKRLIYCLDGTWNTYDTDYPANVVMFHKTVARADRQGVRQIAYYDSGVGTEFGQKVLGGALGLGLVGNIMQAYKHLCDHYEPGDEIYIVGFSRGAYTARSFAGMICLCGVVDRPDRRTLDEALAHYRQRNSDPKKRRSALKTWRARHSPRVCANDGDYEERRARAGGCGTCQTAQPRGSARVNPAW